jgi:hypothetical protein
MSSELFGPSLPRGTSGGDGGGGGGGALPTPLDKGLAPLATSGNQQPTGVLISATPAGGYIDVRVNGITYRLGDGVMTEACYFSNGIGGARSIGAVIAGDELYWNGLITGFDLALLDRVDLGYVV